MKKINNVDLLMQRIHNKNLAEEQLKNILEEYTGQTLTYAYEKGYEQCQEDTRKIKSNTSRHIIDAYDMEKEVKINELIQNHGAIFEKNPKVLQDVEIMFEYIKDEVILEYSTFIRK
jgi:hypothetical protein